LSDTLYLANLGPDSSGATVVEMLFASGIEGGPALTPLAGATKITETGGVQTPIVLDLRAQGFLMLL
jgi:hypothetical protein